MGVRKENLFGQKNAIVEVHVKLQLVSLYPRMDDLVESLLRQKSNSSEDLIDTERRLNLHLASEVKQVAWQLKVKPAGTEKNLTWSPVR